jgi:predicted ATPase
VAEYIALEFPGNALPTSFTALIHAKTEGHPLFVADVLGYLRDRGVVANVSGQWELARPTPDIARDLPQSVRSLIKRKVDRLSEDDRRLLLAASVQGYGFDSAVIARALGVDPADVEDGLERIEQAHALVRLQQEQEFPDHTVTLRYRFTHALYHDALYSALKPTRRAGISHAVAEALLAFYGRAQAGEIAGELGFLFEAARDFARAADYFLIAAQNAAQLFAHAEAAKLARLAVNLIQRLPESSARSEKELAGQMALGVSLMATMGFAAPEVEETYRRAHELCRHVDQGPHLFRALWGLWSVHQIRAQFHTARRLADRIMELAGHERALLLQAHYASGFTRDYMGDHLVARAHYQEVMTLYDPDLHRSHSVLYGLDPKSTAMSRLCWVTWVLGYPDQAQTLLDEFISAARGVGHPFSTSSALLTAPQLYWEFQQPARALELAEEAMTLSTDYGFPQALAYAGVHHGWAIAKQGRLDAGVTEMRQNFNLLHAIGVEMSLTGYQVSLAEVLGAAGRAVDGLKVIAEGLARADETGERFFEAELYRVRGELRLQQGEEDAALDFSRAIELARGREAKSHELRAAISLALLWQRQGEPARARNLLAPLYAWFREGYNTPDLTRARSVLEGLAAGGSV